MDHDDPMTVIKKAKNSKTELKRRKTHRERGKAAGKDKATQQVLQILAILQKAIGKRGLEKVLADVKEHVA